MARTPLSIPFSGAKLRAQRELKGWRQEDLSDRTAQVGNRIGRDWISRYETGVCLPSVTRFGILVQALQCEAKDLLEAAA